MFVVDVGMIKEYYGIEGLSFFIFLKDMGI